jgi:PII-like signaling protein
VQDTTIIKFATGETAPAPAAKKGELMRLIGKAKMLRVHIGENDRWEGEPLYEAIVKRAAQLDIAGATVYRGILGYGAHKRIHRHKTMTFSSDDPIMVSMVDEEEKINQMISALDTMVSGGCLIAISDVTVVKYVEHGNRA